MPQTNWQERVDSGDWDAITAELNDFGGAMLPRLLTDGEADAIQRLYPADGMFRATIDMSRYRFGEGEYRYFQQPYPEPIEALKQSLYPRLLPIAREWWADRQAVAVARYPQRLARHVSRGGPGESYRDTAQVRRR